MFFFHIRPSLSFAPCPCRIVAALNVAFPARRLKIVFTITAAWLYAVLFESFEGKLLAAMNTLASNAVSESL